MIDYELKSILLNTDLVYMANKIERYKYLDLHREKYPNIYIPSNLDIQLLKMLHFGQEEILLNDGQIVNGEYIYQECLKINNSMIKRKIRLENRILNMLFQGKCYFVTLTFSDDVLNNTTPQARKRRVRDFLKENYLEYVANIDYGSKNDREHYHAVCLYKHKFDYSKWYNKDYPSRFNTQLIKTSVKLDKLAEYISILTNHAIKKTTKRQPLIYSKIKKRVLTPIPNYKFNEF